jgi:hypothetical protein
MDFSTILLKVSTRSGRISSVLGVLLGFGYPVVNE